MAVEIVDEGPPAARVEDGFPTDVEQFGILERVPIDRR